MDKTVDPTITPSMEGYGQRVLTLFCRGTTQQELEQEIEQDDQRNKSNSSGQKITVKAALRHYKSILSATALILGVSVPFLYVISLIPYGDLTRGPVEYYSRGSTVLSFILATTCFGPIYLGYALYLMTDFTNLRRGNFIHGLVIHAAIWPLVYTAFAFGLQWNYWFYYFDFVWFLLAFVPIAFHASYSLLWNPILPTTSSKTALVAVDLPQIKPSHSNNSGDDSTIVPSYQVTPSDSALIVDVDTPPASPPPSPRVSNIRGQSRAQVLAMVASSPGSSSGGDAAVIPNNTSNSDSSSGSDTMDSTISNPTPTNATTTTSTSSSLWKYLHLSERMRLAIMFTVSELFVIASALGYTFFLFPLYTQLSSDTWKVLWRMLLHPLWFELTMILPQRLIALKELNTMTTWRFIPVMHSLFHSATIGRMLINNISNPIVGVIVSLLTNFQEILFRITAYKRDFISLKIIYGNVGNRELKALHGTIVNVEMIMEICAIVVSPVMMVFFQRYGILFSWNSPDPSNPDAQMMMNDTTLLLSIMVLQLVTEALTDVFCIVSESRRYNIVTSWRKVATWPFLCFLTYGFCAMGILGMIYTCLRLPRGVYCSDPSNFCSCNYGHKFCNEDGTAFLDFVYNH